MSDSRFSAIRREVPCRRGRAGATALAVAALTLSACSAGSADPGAVARSRGGSSSTAGTDTPPGSRIDQPSVHTNVKRGSQDVAVDEVVEVSTDDGQLRSVQVTSAAGTLAGAVSGDKSSWKATGRLEPGTAYTVETTVQGKDSQVTRRTGFTTQALTLDQQTFASVAPLAGETVGVGMPVIVSFDVPVTDRASMEKHMTVTSSPSQVGTWHWLSDTEAHWRPESYWKAGTDVSVDVDVNSVSAGNGIYGQESRKVDFKVGDANVYKVNAQTDQMQVLSNGRLLRTIPITTGKAGFTTRSGTKVIMEKFASRRMNSETVGITGSEAYNLANVQYAMRLTYSGEFLHAAPWSVSSQGNANVSHGCTGMSTKDAAWLFGISKRGDVVETTGTDRPMTLDNGYGDWNESFGRYRQGSAAS